MNNKEIFFMVGETGWIASYIVNSDSSVIATIISDNNGFERDRERYFPSISALKKYLDNPRYFN